MNYPGGKNSAGVAMRLVNLMPPHPVYIEPFLGSGAVMRLKKPAALNIGIDLDHTVKLPTLAGPGESTERRRRRAAKFHIVHGDGIGFLETYPFIGEELVYCDPPYLLSTRTGGRRYRCELSDVGHRRLLRAVLEIPARVLVSGYHSELYAEALKGWNSVHYRQIQHTGECRTEWIWYNYPAPTELHDYRFLGRNCRERQDLRRMVRSWTGKLSRMPILKRRALLEAIRDLYEVETPSGSADGELAEPAA